MLQLVVACRVTPLSGRDLLVAFRPALLVSGLVAVVGTLGVALMDSDPWPTLLVSGTITLLAGFGAALVLGRRWWRQVDPLHHVPTAELAEEAS